VDGRLARVLARQLNQLAERYINADYAADNVVRVGEISPDDFRAAVERIFECIPLKARIKNFSGTSYVTSVFRRRYGLSWGLSHLEYLR